MFNRKPKPGIRVIVTETRYDCYGFGETVTPRDLWLMLLIKGEGGISDTVAPGEYVFNAKRVGFHLVGSLNPA